MDVMYRYRMKGDRKPTADMGYVLIDATARIRRHRIDRRFGEHSADLVESLESMAPREGPGMRFDNLNLRRTVVWLLAMLAAAGVSGPVAAAAQHAKPAGARGFEHVHALMVAADGRTLWLGAHTGLFRSADGGRTWQSVELSDTSSHLDVVPLVEDPRDGRVVYVGTHEAGVFRTQEVYAASEDGKTYVSTDGGTLWTKRP